MYIPRNDDENIIKDEFKSYTYDNLIKKSNIYYHKGLYNFKSKKITVPSFKYWKKRYWFIYKNVRG